MTIPNVFKKILEDYQMRDSSIDRLIDKVLNNKKVSANVRKKFLKRFRGVVTDEKSDRTA